MTKRNIFKFASKVVLLSSILLAQNISAKNIEWTKESPKRMNWNNAQKYCKNLNARLPKYEEIEAVWINNNKSSEIDGFDGSVSYWTSTVEPSNYNAAHPFYFGEGKKGWYYKDDHYGVRCIKN